MINSEVEEFEYPVCVYFVKEETFLTHEREFTLTHKCPGYWGLPSDGEVKIFDKNAKVIERKITKEEKKGFFGKKIVEKIKYEYRQPEEFDIDGFKYYMLHFLRNQTEPPVDRKMPDVSKHDSEYTIEHLLPIVVDYTVAMS